MAKIRKIYDQTIKPDGSKLTIYPITSTRAVYTPESITMEALINEGYRFGGVIEHLADSPEFTDQRVFYLADKVGVYPNFGNLTLAGGELGVFCYNKSQWIKGILKGGGTNLTGYQVVTSASLLPDEESTIGYIIGTNLYVWVGEGGDTKEGKYKNVGPFVGPQGNGIEQVFLSPTNYKLTIDFTDGTSWTSEQSIRGITGAKGDKGDPGLTGAAGATGPKGAKGDKGDSGVSLGDVVLTADLDETETGKALDASAMQTIPHWVDEEQEIEDVPSNYYTRTQTDQKLLNYKAEVNQHLTNQDNDIARLEDRIDNMVDGVDEFIHHRPTVINNGTIINAPDDEDLVATEENTLKFADRPAINAMGYVILRKNKTFAEQVTATDTIYEIRYDFNLDGESVTIPTGCVLKFVGGSLSDGTVTGNNTEIRTVADGVFNNITLAGTFGNAKSYPEWFTGMDDADKVNNCLVCADTVVIEGNLAPSSRIFITKPATLTGSGKLTFASSVGGGSSLETRGCIKITSGGVKVRGLSFSSLNPGTSGTGNEGAVILEFLGSLSTHISTLEVSDCKFNVAEVAIGMTYCDESIIKNNTISNMTRTGMEICSGNNIVVTGNIIKNLNLNNYRTNSYGIMLSYHGTGTEPSCHNCAVTGNTIIDNPYWEGIDTHGGQFISITGNVCRNCYVGIAAVSNHAGLIVEDVTIVGNTIEASGTSVSEASGIRIAGLNGTNLLRRAVVSDNTIKNGVRSIYVSYVREANISNNMVHATAEGLLINSSSLLDIIGNKIILGTDEVTGFKNGIRCRTSTQTGVVDDDLNQIKISDNTIIARDGNGIFAETNLPITGIQLCCFNNRITSSGYRYQSGDKNAENALLYFSCIADYYRDHFDISSVAVPAGERVLVQTIEDLRSYNSLQYLLWSAADLSGLILSEGHNTSALNVYLFNPTSEEITITNRLFISGSFYRQGYTYK